MKTLSDFYVIIEPIPKTPGESSPHVSLKRVFFVSLFSVLGACSWGVVIGLCAQAAGFAAWNHGNGQETHCVYRYCIIEAVRDAKFLYVLTLL